MNAKKILIIVAVIAIISAVITGLIIKQVFGGPQPVPTSQEQPTTTVTQAPLDPAVKVTAAWSKARGNTVSLTVSGLGGKVSTLAYEFSYESGGLIKGVNSGSNKIDVSGKDAFTREVYLGTCSKNDCRPDAGVNKVSVVIEFNYTDGKQSQFSGDFNLNPETSQNAPVVTPRPVSD